MKESLIEAPKIIIGCDPSFAHLGIAVINRFHKSFRTWDIQTELGKQDFLNVYNKSQVQVKNVQDYLKKIIPGNPDYNVLESLDTVIGMENALPWGFNATTLTSLDIMLLHAFSPIRTAVFNPTYLSYIMGKHTKKDSINLATALANILEKNDYTFTEHYDKNMTDGEAEAFIYACRMLCRTCPDGPASKQIMELQPLFKDEKEKYNDDFIY